MIVEIKTATTNKSIGQQRDRLKVRTFIESTEMGGNKVRDSTAVVVQVKPYDQETTAQDSDLNRRDRNVRILCAFLGQYSGPIERLSSHLQALTVVYQLSICLVATFCLGVVIATGFTSDEGLTLSFSMRLMHIIVAIYATICGWFNFYRCHANTGFHLYYKELTRCIQSLKEMGAQVSFKFSFAHSCTVFYFEAGTVAMVGWFAVDEAIFNDNGITGEDLETRVSGKAKLKFVEACGITLFVIKFIALLQAYVLFCNTGYTTASLFKTFNEYCADYDGIMTARQLREVRLVYNKLCDLVRLLDTVWSPFLGLSLATLSVTPLLVLYSLSWVISDPSSGSALLVLMAIWWILGTVVIIGLLAYVSDLNTTQVRTPLNPPYFIPSITANITSSAVTFRPL